MTNSDFFLHNADEIRSLTQSTTNFSTCFLDGGALEQGGAVLFYEN